MKKFMYSLLVILFSCNASTDSKISDALKKIEVKEMAGEKIESIDIDSVDYGTVSMQNYYQYRETLFNTIEAARINKNLELSKLSPSDSILVRVQKDNNRSKHLQSVLDSLEKNADTTKNIFQINYRVNAKTDKNSYNLRRTKFLKTDDLSEIKIKLDNY